jgi:hypothetical protein
MGWLHRRTGRALTLALSAVWVVTLAFADTAVTPVMHCQRGHMPCCPRSGNGESCSDARCTEQVPEKAEAQGVQAKEGESQAVIQPVLVDGAHGFAREPVRELTEGLHYRSPVLNLKDDFRI